MTYSIHKRTVIDRTKPNGGKVITKNLDETVKYVRPTKMGHGQGRNPDYPSTIKQFHAPFNKAVKRLKAEVSKPGEMVSEATALAEEALRGSKRLTELYKDELTKEGR